MTKFKWQEGKLIFLVKLWIESELKHHLKQYFSLAQGFYSGLMV